MISASHLPRENVGESQPTSNLRFCAPGNDVAIAARANIASSGSKTLLQPRKGAAWIGRTFLVNTFVTFFTAQVSPDC